MRFARTLENGAVAEEPKLAFAVSRPRLGVSPYSNHPVEGAFDAISPMPLQRALDFVISVATLVITLLNLTETGGMYGAGPGF